MSEQFKIGVIGAGHMGSGIAQKIAQEGLDVVLIDIKPEFVDKGLENIKKLFQAGIKRRLFSGEQVIEFVSRITGTTDFNTVADCDIIVEAVFEDKKVKLDLFQKLDKICNEKTIFATNTSSFYVKEFAKQIKRPDRFIGLHYFFHPAKNRLLEIIPHDDTSQETVEKCKMFAKLHGKTPIIVKDSPGFAVNRFFIPSSNEACRMVEEGMGNIATIEKASKIAFGIGMGSFEILNVTGIPLAVHASQSLGDELGLFYKTPDILQKQMDKKQDWDINDGPVDEEKIQPAVERFYGICLGVAATLVDEGTASMEDINLGAKVGLRWQMGPFEIMNKIGINETCRMVEAMTQKYPGFAMPRILLEQHKMGIAFKFKVVKLDIKQNTAWITINRPDAMNALNEEVIDQIDSVFTIAENHSDVKAIVFQGAGKTFVAGADIQFFVDNVKAGTVNNIEAFTRRGHELFLRIEQCKKKTITLLDGLSLGGGSELALACQYIVATPSGSMGFPETGIGIIPGLGGMIRTQRIIGTQLAKYFVFIGETINAKDALALGLIYTIAEPAMIESVVEVIIKDNNFKKYKDLSIPKIYQDRADVFRSSNIDAVLNGADFSDIPTQLNDRVVKILGKKSNIALKMANDVMNAQIPMTIKQAVEYELKQVTKLFGTTDALEGLTSTIEHRKPEFKGNKS